MSEAKRVTFSFDERSLESVEKLKRQGRHTPGPWARGSVLDRGEAVIAIDQPQHKRIIALIEWNRDSLTEGANARLIAAAPDLLAALKELLPEGWGDSNTMDHMPGVKSARLAIAKAEGRAK